jgi:hypothetical protein
VQRSEEIEELFRALYASLLAGDPGPAEAMFADGGDVLMIGTDPAEWWVGRESILDHWSMQLKEMAGFRLEPGAEIHAFAEGDVGWFADQPSFVAPDGTRVPGRFTAVVRREGGNWRIVQGHASIGVADEESIGPAATT